MTEQSIRLVYGTHVALGILYTVLGCIHIDTSETRTSGAFTVTRTRLQAQTLVIQSISKIWSSCELPQISCQNLLQYRRQCCSLMFTSYLYYVLYK